MVAEVVFPMSAPARQREFLAGCRGGPAMKAHRQPEQEPAAAFQHGVATTLGTTGIARLLHLIVLLQFPFPLCGLATGEDDVLRDLVHGNLLWNCGHVLPSSKHWPFRCISHGTAYQAIFDKARTDCFY
jgi:hypothetical protein